MTAPARWRRESFDRACARRGPGGLETYREPTPGWVLRPCWGLHRDGGRWRLTHLPTGSLVPGGSFAALATGKQFAEELSREVDCNIGSFGKSLRGVRGGPALKAALGRCREVYAFNPVRPTGRVEYGKNDKPARFYPETRRAVERESGRASR